MKIYKYIHNILVRSLLAPDNNCRNQLRQRQRLDC